ncbi:DUF1382 family protein [Chromobacterium phragmitis]|uniref:DUF1382 family protein n=1 Tax=Chromobacterium phragmitis TaxID=2202141 RepID=UPI00387816C5
MNRAHPADLRKALIVANELAGIGVLFVPVAVSSKEEFAQRMGELGQQLEQIAQEAETE